VRSTETLDAPILRKLLRTPFEIPWTPIDYKAVHARLSSHPEEAFWSDPFDGSCFLHELLYCDDVPLFVVLKAISVHPDALRQRTFDGAGDTPLHIACHSMDAKASIVKSLLNAYRKAVFIEPSPLHRALDFSRKGNVQDILRSVERVEVVKLLLEANPAASIEHAHDPCLDPMQWLAHQWTNTVDFDDHVYDHLLKIMKLLLRFRFLARKHTSKSNQSFLYLHAALQEDQIMLYHMGCKKVMNLMELEKFRICLLRNRRLDAFMCDQNAKLALHLAAERGLKWCAGLRDIYLAAPRAIETRDVCTHMYPFMISSVGKHANLETTFELLRTNPSMLKRYIE